MTDGQLESRKNWTKRNPEYYKMWRKNNPDYGRIYYDINREELNRKRREAKDRKGRKNKRQTFLDYVIMLLKEDQKMNNN